MRVRSLLRVGGVVGAAALTLGLVAPASHAERTEVSFEDAVWGAVYDNMVTGVDPDDPLVLFAGVSLEGVCDQEGTTATLRARAKGDARIDRLVDRGPLYVYDFGGLSFIEFIGGYCAGVITDAPEPVAVGKGTIRFRVELTFDGEQYTPTSVTDTVNGSVRTSDGDTWAVNGSAQTTFDPDENFENVSFTVRNKR